MSKLPLQLTTAQILAMRPAIERPVPSLRPIELLHEWEACDKSGGVASVLTVLLRGSECSFRCLMCDLWQSTHPEPTPRGNIPAQIRFALRQAAAPLPSAGGVDGHSNASCIKLYNASNFFAPVNVPTEDLAEIAELVKSYDRVVVENHPCLVGDRIRSFADRISGRLEIAMGLETVEPQVLKSLNKQMTVEDVQRATEWLHKNNIDVRLFVLLQPPGLSESAAMHWCLASIEAARGWGVRHVSVIPVRGGNGAIDYLQNLGHFEPPTAACFEHVIEQSVSRSTMIVTADLWDWGRLGGLCTECVDARRKRMERINLTQAMAAPIDCPCQSRL
jgi:archaeosine synthase beta-subunit